MIHCCTFSPPFTFTAGYAIPILAATPRAPRVQILMPSAPNCTSVCTTRIACDRRYSQTPQLSKVEGTALTIACSGYLTGEGHRPRHLAVWVEFCRTVTGSNDDLSGGPEAADGPSIPDRIHAVKSTDHLTPAVDGPSPTSHPNYCIMLWTLQGRSGPWHAAPPNHITYFSWDPQNPQLLRFNENDFIRRWRSIPLMPSHWTRWSRRPKALTTQPRIGWCNYQSLATVIGNCSPTCNDASSCQESKKQLEDRFTMYLAVETALPSFSD